MIAAPNGAMGQRTAHADDEKILVFQLAGCTFGLPIESVREIVGNARVIRLPFGAGTHRGVVAACRAL